MLAPNEADAAARRQFLLCAFLLWLAGNGLRITILSVPPVIPPIRSEFGMSETQVGILTGLPPVLFACTAVLGSLLIARFGALNTLIAGLFATAAGSALRGLAPDIWFLYGATIVTGFGVAIMHPSLPPLVRGWLPHRIGFGTALFTNGLLVGEILPVALTIPLVLPLLHDSWRASFILWAVPCRHHCACHSVCGAATVRLGAGEAGRATLVAELARSADLAARHRAWQRQFHVLLGERVPPRLSAPRRTRRPRERGTDSTQSRADPGLVPAARGGGTARTRDLAARGVWRMLACGDRRHCGPAGDGDRGLRGHSGVLRGCDPDPDAGAAAAARAARRRASCVGGDVHDQLFVRRDHACVQRIALGPDRGSAGPPSCRLGHALSC